MRIFSANLPAVGKAGQRKLANSCVGVAGLGGVGGVAFELLVRTGIGRVKIADCGFFEESNANRQSLWSRENDGREKTKAAKEFAASVSRACKTIVFPGINSKNTFRFSSGCAAVIDATDTAGSRMAIWRGCKKAGVPYIFASARGTRGMLSVFSGKDFEKEFGLAGASARKPLPCDHALGPVANAIGCLAAQQAVNAVLGKPTIEFPRILSLDGFSGEMLKLHEF